jgi:hypothetical protein
MKITRKTNVLVKTERRFVVRQHPSDETIQCGQCAELLIPAQMSADFFGISSRTIYRLIESGKIHFVETEANEIYICSASLKEILE